VAVSVINHALDELNPACPEAGLEKKAAPLKEREGMEQERAMR
jgi:hypothetical protein